MSDTLPLRALAVNHPAEAADAAIRRVAELEAENARLRAERAWQPIETAPKVQLVLVGTKGCQIVDIAMQMNSLSGWLGITHGDEGREWEYFEVGEPTHWMPLPEPPAL